MRTGPGDPIKGAGWARPVRLVRVPAEAAESPEEVGLRARRKTQVAAFNLGLLVLLLEPRGLGPAPLGAFGVVLVWTAGVWALLKCWSFALLARVPGMSARASRYWLPLDGRGTDSHSAG